MTLTSSNGDNIACRERRISDTLFGTTTTRFGVGCPGIVGEATVDEFRNWVGGP